MMKLEDFFGTNFYIYTFGALLFFVFMVMIKAILINHNKSSNKTKPPNDIDINDVERMMKENVLFQHIVFNKGNLQ